MIWGMLNKPCVPNMHSFKTAKYNAKWKSFQRLPANTMSPETIFSVMFGKNFSSPSLTAVSSIHSSLKTTVSFLHLLQDTWPGRAHTDSCCQWAGGPESIREGNCSAGMSEAALSGTRSNEWCVELMNTFWKWKMINDNEEAVPVWQAFSQEAVQPSLDGLSAKSGLL